MYRNIKKYSKKAGMPPGTLVHIGKVKTGDILVSLIEYNENIFNETKINNIQQYTPISEKSVINWLNIDGVHNTETIEKIGALYNLHPLTLEDIVNTGQMPKIEEYDNYTFIVLKMLYYNDNNKSIEVEQISICLGNNFVLTFQEEKEKDAFKNVKDRLRLSKGRLRKAGADYLVYSMIDSVVDSYFLILEKIGEKIELLEEQVLNEPSEQVLHQIHALKREMIFLRKTIWPVRDVISTIEKGGSNFILDSMHIYFRDVYDHTIRVIETIETYRDILSGILDIYLSSISNRINAVMKVLTIIATIFMPLTFLAGIYGMNFEYMPELKWKWGYPLILAIMLFIGVTMVIYFKKKDWL
ncbi:MAG: magnesium/cobalt transporter CorA [Nitrospirae bacterium]|jgi:magnesium transporter|nr:magnesium/cobalt transporter CorA [Nitrospirota bacterium]